jgi:hypothetical protein
MSVAAVLERLASSLAHRQAEWDELREEKSEFGDYAVAQAVAGMALDELVYSGPAARAVCAAFEHEYQVASPVEEELLRVGVFEELSVLLRAQWMKTGEYEEKRSIVRAALGPIALGCFDAWEKR